jgi:DNA phosphorothioation-dependent restriction protein DptG
MVHFFKYNWEIRDEWMVLCRQLPHDELIRERLSGVGSILKTLFHVIDVEYSWIQALNGNPDSEPKYQDYMTLELVQNLSNDYRGGIKEFLNSWSSDMEYKELTVPWSGEIFYYGEVLRHVIAHEIHHVGQLSVWAKKLGIKPVSANFIERGLM